MRTAQKPSIKIKINTEIYISENKITMPEMTINVEYRAYRVTGWKTTRCMGLVVQNNV